MAKKARSRSKSKTKRSGSSSAAKKRRYPSRKVRRQGVFVSDDGRCAEMTVDRDRCKNPAQAGSKFCWVHERPDHQHEDEFFDSTFARVHPDGLWIGSLDTAHDPHALKSAGIRSIVNISGWEPTPKARDMYRKKGIHYYTLTKRDHNGRQRYLGDEPIGTGRLTLDEFYDYMDRGVQYIDRARKPVLVNCHAGINRSASLCAAWMMAKRGMPFSQCHQALVNANRKRETPVLTNRYFVKALQKYPKWLQYKRIRQSSYR